MESNVQKMREIIKGFVEAFDGDGIVYGSEVDGLLEQARSALALPLRNCDMFATVKDAAIEFSKLRNNPHPCPDFVFSEWLLAPAAERQGETK